MILQGNPWHLVLVSLSNLQLDFSTCNTVSGSVHLSKKKKKAKQKCKSHSRKNISNKLIFNAEVVAYILNLLSLIVILLWKV